MTWLNEEISWISTSYRADAMNEARPSINAHLFNTTETGYKLTETNHGVLRRSFSFVDALDSLWCVDMKIGKFTSTARERSCCFCEDSWFAACYFTLRRVKFNELLGWKSRCPFKARVITAGTRMFNWPWKVIQKPRSLKRIGRNINKP